MKLTGTDVYSRFETFEQTCKHMNSIYKSTDVNKLFADDVRFHTFCIYTGSCLFMKIIVGHKSLWKYKYL